MLQKKIINVFKDSTQVPKLDYLLQEKNMLNKTLFLI